MLDASSMGKAEKISRQLSFSGGLGILAVNLPPHWDAYWSGEMSSLSTVVLTGAAIAVCEGAQKYVEAITATALPTPGGSGARTKKGSSDAD